MAKPKKKVTHIRVEKSDELSRAHDTEQDRPHHKTTSFGKYVAKKTAEEITENAKKGKR